MNLKRILFQSLASALFLLGCTETTTTTSSGAFGSDTELTRSSRATVMPLANPAGDSGSTVSVQRNKAAEQRGRVERAHSPLNLRGLSSSRGMHCREEGGRWDVA